MVTSVVTLVTVVAAARATIDPAIEPLHIPDVYGATSPDVKIADFGEDFEFGLATAPAHVEDELNDAWLAFAEEGRVAAWQGTPRARERTQRER